jgi:hypothetical protein
METQPASTAASSIQSMLLTPPIIQALDSNIEAMWDRPIAFQRIFCKFGGVTAALMLSQAVYWSKRTKNKDGWFYKTQADWEEETGLTRREQETARKSLKGILECKLQGVPATTHYRVNFQILKQNIELAARENSQTSMAESAKLDCTKAPNQIARNEQTIVDRTETTSETTSQKREEMSPLVDESYRFVEWFMKLLIETEAKVTELTPSSRALWADTYQKLVRIDGKEKEEIVSVCRWARNDSFWKGAFMSPAALREKKNGISKYDQFLNRMNSPTQSTGRKAYFA